jgi:hypothetical protein
MDERLGTPAAESVPFGGFGRDNGEVTARTRAATVAAGAAFLLGAEMLGLPAASAVVSPINPSNTPTPLAGVTNGEVPASDLVGVAPGCQAARAAGPSLGLLLAEARERRVLLGTEQCYRSLAGEIAAAAGASSAGNSACAAPVPTGPNGKPVGTSFHGWGKAADFYDADGELAFGSPGYQFLKTYAAQVGWNHPGWAEPGGSACPEAWHWEWVGDGGSQGDTPIEADVVAVLDSADQAGFATVTGLGAVTAHGDFTGHGDASTLPISWLVVGATSAPHGGGYWLVASDGGVFNYGSAAFHGSAGNLALVAPVVGMASTPDGGGYWLVAADGGVFSYGDARFHGSAGNLHLSAPVVGMASTPDGGGYWLVAADGGVFSYGDARFYGSMGDQHLDGPVVGLAPTAGGHGYWMVGSDGGIFNFGDAAFHGSAALAGLTEPAVGITATPDGGGYRVVSASGAVIGFGDASSG